MNFFDLTMEFQKFKQTYKDLFDYRECRYDVKPIVYPSIESAFDSELLSNSFIRPQVVMYCEYIATDYLLKIQKIIDQQACNAENICLVTNHTVGCSDWWESYKKLHGIKSFKIIEAPWFWTCNSFFTSQIDPATMDAAFWKNNRSIDKLFCVYGGSKTGWPERQYLILKLLEFADHGVIDYIGQFESKQIIENYAEQATCFVNQAEVEHVLELYDRYVGKDSKLTVAPAPVQQPTDWTGFYWNFPEGVTVGPWATAKHCLAHVVRETRGWDQFCTVTEKTLSTFLYHLAYLPVSGVNNADHMEQLGFKLAPGLVDYSYTREFHYASRIQQLCDQLDQIKHWTPDDLTQYYLENFDYFQYNFEYIISQQLFLKIQKQLKEDFEQFLFKDTPC